MPMVERTGTLWEMKRDPRGIRACAQGFLTWNIELIYMAFLGVELVDPVAKKIRLDPPLDGPGWASGRIPVAEGIIEFTWERKGSEIQANLTVPGGYQWEIVNPEHVQLREPVISRIQP
jgi:hypothetical protein